jgi:hypothetical protein
MFVSSYSTDFRNEGHKILVMLVFSGYLSSVNQAMERKTNGTYHVILWNMMGPKIASNLFHTPLVPFLNPIFQILRPIT